MEVKVPNYCTNRAFTFGCAQHRLPTVLYCTALYSVLACISLLLLGECRGCSSCMGCKLHKLNTQTGRYSLDFVLWDACWTLWTNNCLLTEFMTLYRSAKRLTIKVKLTIMFFYCSRWAKTSLWTAVWNQTQFRETSIPGAVFSFLWPVGVSDCWPVGDCQICWVLAPNP